MENNKIVAYISEFTFSRFGLKINLFIDHQHIKYALSNEEQHQWKKKLTPSIKEYVWQQIYEDLEYDIPLCTILEIITYDRLPITITTIEENEELKITDIQLGMHIHNEEQKELLVLWIKTLIY